MTEVILDSQELDRELDWARALLTKHRAKITQEFYAALVFALDPSPQITRAPEITTFGATGRVIYKSQLPPQFVTLLSTLGTDEV